MYWFGPRVFPQRRVDRFYSNYLPSGPPRPSAAILGPPRPSAALLGPPANWARRTPRDVAHKRVSPRPRIL
ncbi:hypothetical protein EVAR_9001_1 [Eumeta japonica]|uniref:Uncharacterized protein n=1 Tax=Eumeta variegata TaxID=151549 RepID=A0A4C1WSY3_EUMVA|nr:hypothetical protein EVAR_9001_1 [Eumeta japonica]